MSNCTGIFLLTLLVVLGSGCLKRPEGRKPPRLAAGENTTIPGGALTCSDIRSAVGEPVISTRCGSGQPETNVPDREEIDTSTATTDTETLDKDTDEEVLEPVSSDTELAAIRVAASCGDGNACLFRHRSKNYWLQCVIVDGGCHEGFHYRVETNKAAVIKDNRNKICLEGGKTVAELAANEIKLKCETDEKLTVGFNLLPKKAELILNQNHLDARKLCVITHTDALGGGLTSLHIRAAACDVNTPRQLELQFSWSDH